MWLLVSFGQLCDELGTRPRCTLVLTKDSKDEIQIKSQQSSCISRLSLKSGTSVMPSSNLKHFQSLC